MHGRASHNAKAVYLYELKAKALIGSPARPMQVEHIQTSDALNKAMCKDGGG